MTASKGRSAPRPLRDFNLPTGELDFLLTDVDDTITNDGMLYPEALSALWRCRDAGMRVILVTGGSAGWADAYFRLWPVEAVVTESGAVAWYRGDSGRGEIIHPSILRSGYREKADRLIARVLSEVPGSKLSSDQFSRIYDIAFDHHDQPPFLDQKGISRIAAICREEGASFGISSIHVNCWFGSYDKLSTAALLLKSVYGLDEEGMRRRTAFCGDAPNDAPLFAALPLSFGVANIAPHLASLPVQPAYVAESRGGFGFAEIVAKLLEMRAV